MTLYTLKLLRTAAAIVVVTAATSVASLQSASAKRLDCSRMAGLLVQQHDVVAGYLDAPPEMLSKSMQRRVRSYYGLQRVYWANCQEFSRRNDPSKQGEEIMQGILGAAIGLGGSYLGGGGRSYGHGPRVQRGSHPTGRTGSSGRRYW